MSELSRLHNRQQGGGPAILHVGGTGSTGVSVLATSGSETVSSSLKMSRPVLPRIQNTSSVLQKQSSTFHWNTFTQPARGFEAKTHKMSRLSLVYSDGYEEVWKLFSHVCDEKNQAKSVTL